ncbi:MAG: hypothetical protein ACK5FE_16750 [Cyanobacteriota bacterium]
MTTRSAPFAAGAWQEQSATDDPPGDPGEDPYSPGTGVSLPPGSSEAGESLGLDQPLGMLGGAAIGLLSLLVPLLSVMTDRMVIGPPPAVSPSLSTLKPDGSQSPAALALPWTGESRGGNPGRQQQ